MAVLAVDPGLGATGGAHRNQPKPILGGVDQCRQLVNHLGHLVGPPTAFEDTLQNPLPPPSQGIGQANAPAIVGDVIGNDPESSHETKAERDLGSAQLEGLVNPVDPEQHTDVMPDLRLHRTPKIH